MFTELPRLTRRIFRKSDASRAAAFPDLEPADLEFIKSLDGFTMTSLERRYHLLNAVRYVVGSRIPGAIVECGVWRGGSMMLAAKCLVSLGRADKELYLFDTFSGMTPPTSIDVDIRGVAASDRLAKQSAKKEKSAVWAIASLDDVKRNMAQTGYPERLLKYVAGDVQQTLPSSGPEQISLLRLDTDWYASTKTELIHLYPRVAKGGVVIIDDYGDWKGARQAVDEFVRDCGDPILLHRIDSTGRSFVKLSEPV